VVPGILLLALIAPACSPPEVVEISIERPAKDLPMFFSAEASSSQRFRTDDDRFEEPEVDLAELFEWTQPEGWERLPGGGMRVIDLRPAGDPRAECYLTVLAGDGGGITANVNRWRNQLGLEPQSAAEVDALPTLTLMERPATSVDLRGSYVGMGDEAREGWALMGAMLVSTQGTLFVKMTGPAELLEAEREAFESFCASLKAADQHDSHAGHDHPPGEHPPEPGAEETPEAPVTDDLGEPGFAYQLPEGWREGPPKMLREVNLLVGETTQCYVIVLGGEAGGLEMNVNRWLGEVSAEPLDAAGVAALEQVEILGERAPLVEASGDYTGMGGPTGEDMALLGVPLIRSSASVFVKMVGPRAEVEAARGAFIEFVASLEDQE